MLREHEERIFTLLETSTFADLQSNTGQILRSLSEFLEEEHNSTSDNSPLQLLNEALLMFEACLNAQEKDMSAFQEQQRNMAEQNQDLDMDDEEGGVSVADSSNGGDGNSSEQVEQWYVYFSFDIRMRTSKLKHLGIRVSIHLPEHV